MAPVAVGGLYNQSVAGSESFGVDVQRSVEAAQVAAENDGVGAVCLVHDDLHEGGAKDVTGGPQSSLKAGSFEPVAVRYRPHENR